MPRVPRNADQRRALALEGKIREPSQRRKKKKPKKKRKSKTPPKILEAVDCDRCGRKSGPGYLLTITDEQTGKRARIFHCGACKKPVKKVPFNGTLPNWVIFSSVVKNEDLRESLQMFLDEQRGVAVPRE